MVVDNLFEVKIYNYETSVEISENFKFGICSLRDKSAIGSNHNIAFIRSDENFFSFARQDGKITRCNLKFTGNIMSVETRDSINEAGISNLTITKVILII